MYSIDRACSLNNQGVNLLVAGDSVGAMDSLKIALDILKEAFKDEINTTSCDGLNQASQEAGALPICESPLTVPGLQGMPCYVYDHGTMISRTTNEETSDEMLSLYSAVVLFNMALTCHHEGRLLGRDLALERASLFYDMTVEIVNGNIVPGNISAAILTLLALNNKAQIHYDHCEYIQCVDCLEEVLGIMGSVKAVYSTLIQKNIEGLLLNVVLMGAPTTAQAA
jgi:hypothetical protein